MPTWAASASKSLRNLDGTQTLMGATFLPNSGTDQIDDKAKRLAEMMDGKLLLITSAEGLAAPNVV